MTWDQIGLVAECVALHRIGTLSDILAPIVTALGGKWKGSGRRKRRKSESPEQRDQALLSSLASAGIEID